MSGQGGELWFIFCVVMCLLVALMLICLVKNVRAEEPAIWKVLLAEAADQGPIGLYAVACVIRNRGGDLDGFCGAKRRDLDSFCARQGGSYISIAKDIERKVFEEEGPDTTGGATHFESDRFPVPYWAASMQKTVKIGRHTFYKETR